MSGVLRTDGRNNGAVTVPVAIVLQAELLDGHLSVQPFLRSQVGNAKPAFT